MLTLPRFRLHRPRSIDEALELLAEHRSDARILAGGTDLVVSLRNRLFTPGHVIHLGALRGLDRIDWSPGEDLRVGALATIARLAADSRIRSAFPVIARAAASVAGPTIRGMGTAGGNICLDTRCQWYNQSLFWRSTCGYCLKKDGDVCHVAPGSSICWAAYSGDLAPAFLALEGQAVVASVRGRRRVPLRSFFLEDGLRRMDIASDELVIELHVPAAKAGLRGTYGKLRARGSLDYPLAGVAVAAGVGAGGAFHDVGVALTAVGPRPFAVEGAAEILDGVPAGDEDAIGRAAHLAQRVANPMFTDGALQPAYRRRRVELFTRDALRELSRR